MKGPGFFETYILPAIFVIILLIIAKFLAAVARSLILKSCRRSGIDETLARFLSKLAAWMIILLTILTCLTRFGIHVTMFAAVIGAAVLAVGLAFQGTLSNFSAGVMLLIFRPFKVDQVIDVSGVKGRVVEIELFTTTIDTADNRRIIVPNGNIFGSTIENVSFHGTRRVDISVGTDYGADIDKTREVLQKAAKRVDGVLEDPDIVVVLCELGGSSIDWAIRVWCHAEDYWDVRDALIRAVKYALDKAGVGIPCPQMDVHIDKLDA